MKPVEFEGSASSIKAFDTFSADIFQPNERKEIIDVPCIDGNSGQKTICLKVSEYEIDMLRKSKSIIVTFLPHYNDESIALTPLLTII